MQIDNVGMVNSGLNVERPANSGTSNSSGTPSVANPQAATVSPSDLRLKLDETPDIRQEKVSSLQQVINQGTYSVSGQTIANAMFAELLS